LYKLPDGLLRDVFSPHLTSAIDGSENAPAKQACCGLPDVYRNLHPHRDWRRPDSTAFPAKVNDAPPAVTLLNLFESECDYLESTQSAAEKDSKYGAVT